MTQYGPTAPATLALHAGQSPDPAFGARATPIYFSAGYVFPDTEHAAALFNHERPGHVDTRVSNPTSAVLEERVSALEGGIGAIALASGQSALHVAIVTLMGAGNHIVAPRALGGAARNLLAHTLPRFGIRTTFVDPRCPDEWRDAIRPETRLLFGEALGNPGLEVLDIPAVAAIAHARHVPLLVDATLVTPCLQRPLSLGADLVLHSATEFLGGHGVAVGGLLVDGGQFDWEQSGLFPTLTEPYDGFHGVDFTEESSVAAFLLRARCEALPDFGACLSPMNAFQILQGIETLPLRIQAHVANARAVAAHLADRASVARVAYPGLATHPDHELASRLLPDGSGAVLSFELTGGRDAARAFIDSLKVFSHLANVGDAKSLVSDPSSTTHCRLSAAALAATGIGEGTLRLSVGLEHVDDLIEDLDRGLYAAGRVVGG
ncbi:O-acetylhomoserine aminocarboxypropyltransferase [Azoarcus sp. PA01]|nr:O-acetylhomoserine aminocarboxypropyltransferase [Azoarcus sp. PA01]